MAWKHLIISPMYRPKSSQHPAWPGDQLIGGEVNVNVPKSLGMLSISPNDSTVILKLKGRTSMYHHASMENEEELSKTWKICTKVKDSLVNGCRLENLSWRLWHLHKITCDNKRVFNAASIRRLSRTTTKKLKLDGVEDYGRDEDLFSAPDYSAKPFPLSQTIRKDGQGEVSSRVVESSAAAASKLISPAVHSLSGALGFDEGLDHTTLQSWNEIISYPKRHAEQMENFLSSFSTTALSSSYQPPHEPPTIPPHPSQCDSPTLLAHYQMTREYFPSVSPPASRESALLLEWLDSLSPAEDLPFPALDSFTPITYSGTNSVLFISGTSMATDDHEAIFCPLAATSSSASPLAFSFSSPDLQTLLKSSTVLDSYPSTLSFIPRDSCVGAEQSNPTLVPYVSNGVDGVKMNHIASLSNSTAIEDQSPSSSSNMDVDNSPSLHPRNSCDFCGVTETPLWRKISAYQTLCNACGLCLWCGNSLIDAFLQIIKFTRKRDRRPSSYRLPSNVSNHHTMLLLYPLKNTKNLLHYPPLPPHTNARIIFNALIAHPLVHRCGDVIQMAAHCVMRVVSSAVTTTEITVQWIV